MGNEKRDSKRRGAFLKPNDALYIRLVNTWH